VEGNGIRRQREAERIQARRVTAAGGSCLHDGVFCRETGDAAQGFKGIIGLLKAIAKDDVVGRLPFDSADVAV
jgi:hypothetical protein